MLRTRSLALKGCLLRGRVADALTQLPTEVAYGHVLVCILLKPRGSNLVYRDTNDRDHDDIRHSEMSPTRYFDQSRPDQDSWGFGRFRPAAGWDVGIQLYLQEEYNWHRASISGVRPFCRTERRILQSMRIRGQTVKGKHSPQFWPVMCIAHTSNPRV